VILGTDHYGFDRTLTLTHKNYETPFGILPNPTELTDAIAESIGSELALRGELYHLSEHSIELAAVWLHHMRRGESCEMLPILCGSFVPYWLGTADIEEDEFLGDAIDALRGVISSRRTLVVAAADLAHVGPVFGGRALDFQDHTKLVHEDNELIDAMCKGDPDAFLNNIFETKDCNNVCGVAPIYLAMKILTPTHGSLIAYEHCPADAEHHSTVSICSLLFH
jgi:AmmeMemoRadiSam system protein B